MSLNIELSSSEERELRQAARNCGLQPEELARKVLFAAGETGSIAQSTTKPIERAHEEMVEQRRDWDPSPAGTEYWPPESGDQEC